MHWNDGRVIRRDKSYIGKFHGDFPLAERGTCQPGNIWNFPDQRTIENLFNRGKEFDKGKAINKF